MTKEEAFEKVINIYKLYALVGVWNDRDEIHAIPEEELLKPENYPFLLLKALLLQIEGHLWEADALIKTIPENTEMRLSMEIVNPIITWKEFIERLKYMKEHNIAIQYLVLTAGRPSLLDGFNDFSRIGFLLPRRRDNFINLVSAIYDPAIVPHLYNLCLAEYYYQINNLFDAEVLVSKTIHIFEKNQELRVLFAALNLQAKIMLANGTITKSGSYIKEIRNRVAKDKIIEFSYNINAVEVYHSCFEGNIKFISDWMETDAPDEYGNFNMLDLYRYMIKMRCYLVLDNPSAVIALGEKLRPLLEEGRRHIDLCEISMLESIAYFAGGDRTNAFDTLEKALSIAKRRQYYRLMADEGNRLLEILLAYKKERGETPFLIKIIELTRTMAIKYPLYLKPRYINDKKFTTMEIEILNLLQQGKTKEEIAEYYFISENTVKYHLIKIYQKLGVNTATHAIWHARLLGLIK